MMALPVLGLMMGLAACTSNSPAALPTNLATETTTRTFILTEANLDPAPLATLTPLPTVTSADTATASPVPPTPTPIPPTITPTAVACSSRNGRLETGHLAPDYLPLWLLFRVYLPPCYDERPDLRYPVLYLLHGQSNTEDQWDRLGVPETAVSLFDSGELSPFIIVMPGDRVWTQPSEDKFGKALVEELIPWIDSHYRTLTDRQYRAIGGLSRGAAWALHLGLSSWQLFGAIGTHSLPIFWEDVPSINPWIDQIPLENFPRIYMDIGDQDRPEVLKSTLWFEGLLTDKGIPHEWHLFSGEHNEAYWRSHVEQYLRWYAARW